MSNFLFEQQFTQQEYNEKICAYLIEIGTLMGVVKVKKNKSGNNNTESDKDDESESSNLGNFGVYF